MRTGIDGLPTPHPIQERLPAIYLDDDFTTRLTEAFDGVLAPVFATLDCFADYLDPRLAPEDFVMWLADWVAFPVDEGWSSRQLRELIAEAVELHRWRGTRRGLVAHVELLTHGEVEVVDTGGCTFSQRAGEPIPDGGPPRVTVRVRVDDPSTVDRDRLRTAIVELVPAHVAVSVDVTAKE